MFYSAKGPFRGCIYQEGTELVSREETDITDVSHTRWIYKKVYEKTNSLLPSGVVREGWEGFLYSGCHLKASICQQVPHSFFPAKLWCFRSCSVTGLGRCWLSSGNQYNYSIHESQGWTGARYPITGARAMPGFPHHTATATDPEQQGACYPHPALLPGWSWAVIFFFYSQTSQWIL